MTSNQMFYKRFFDIFCSMAGLMVLWPLIFVSWLLASLETKSNGFFLQSRIGKGGDLFKTIKIKTMYPVKSSETRSTVTVKGAAMITKSGCFLRKFKIDELPQLLNVLLGNMSLVGPRPDVPGYADLLKGEDRVVLSIRPGITGPASLKYKNEEEVLANQENPKDYNDKVIWPDKVKINKAYISDYSMSSDIKYILRTIKG